MARQLGLSAPFAPGAPPAVAAALQPAGATTGQLSEGAVPAPAPPAGAAISPARDHQGFLRGAETLVPAELRVRRDRASGGVSLEAGTVIPAALVTAVDSDVAGPLVAQVTQDVFDREQREVVIPRGSRLIGAYDSQVALGERRLLVAWSRLILPDGSGMSFPGLPAATRAGEAGLAGAVDNHLTRVFGSAVLLSILSAGVQLSQPQESATFGAAASTRQVAAAAVGQQLSSVAIEMLRREMSVPPTIRIAAGTRFLVFLRGDVRGEAPGQE
jgi:type IV secretion system protein VirB10